MSDREDSASEDGERAEAPEPPKKRKKKKKKKKRRAAASESAAPERRPTRDASGADRPAFLLSFPEDPELDRLVVAFESGDYATVQSDAPKLAESSEDARVRDAALELCRRIAPDPLIRYMLFGSIALLVFLVIYFYSNRH